MRISLQYHIIKYLANENNTNELFQYNFSKTFYKKYICIYLLIITT